MGVRYRVNDMSTWWDRVKPLVLSLDKNVLITLCNRVNDMSTWSDRVNYNERTI